LMPSEFVGLAEDTGLIVPIGEWVLAEACRQLAMWRRQGLVPEDFTVSVNLSHRQLSSSRLPAVVAAALERSQVPAQCLCLEATESCVAHEGRHAASVLAALKALGVLLALDDFGTGYSSLSALSSFPVDVVKIDRSFAASVGTQ